MNSTLIHKTAEAVAVRRGETDIEGRKKAYRDVRELAFIMRGLLGLNPEQTVRDRLQEPDVSRETSAPGTAEGLRQALSSAFLRAEHSHDAPRRTFRLRPAADQIDLADPLR